ncbi:hypothetical protein CQY20_19185 [Mycolicibacterium agri]|uniref:Uncharacterized protein n=1 Tax=Mycolicibacterium agri TaxID=36811 RepID=A0A2A7MYW9_MYCAG|nr:hypothetical protein CQY20_19185 [Mycolicibacterium agri]
MAAAASGLSGAASIATASAAPIEWDIETYDDCLKANTTTDPSEQIAWSRKCCKDSGGVWNDTLAKCQSPPANPAQASPSKVVTKVPVQVLEPARPATTGVSGGVFGQTLTP